MFYDPSPIGVDYGEIADRASLLPEPLFLGGSRLVVHIQTTEQAIDDFLSLVAQLAEEKKQAGFVPQPVEKKAGTYHDVYVRRPPKQA